MVHVFKSAFIVLIACHVVKSQQGTTSKLEEIFKGRCLHYRITISQSLNIDCDALWSNFSSSWIFKEPCSQNGGNYDQFIGLLNQTLPKNKSLFWSGTKDLAHKISEDGRRYFALEDTLVGFMVDGLTWCGQTSAPGINYTGCPAYRSCPTESMYNFWVAASKWFSSHAQGEVYVVLNGSDPTRRAYRRDSIFGSVEMLNLKSGQVPKITAIVAHEFGKPIVEKCGEQSLLDLRTDVLAKNINFDCVENPPEVKFLLCVDAPNSPECGPTIQLCDNAWGLMQSGGGICRHIFALVIVLTSLFVKYAST